MAILIFAGLFILAVLAVIVLASSDDMNDWSDEELAAMDKKEDEQL